MPFQRPGLPEGATTRLCGFRPREEGPDPDCWHDACLGGICVANWSDSAVCARPPGCGVMACRPFGDYAPSADTDLLKGCVAVNDCYFGGSDGGGLDGECRPRFAGVPGEEDNSCIECNPTLDPFGGSPVATGTNCDDRRECTVGDTCQPDRPGHAVCVGTVTRGEPCSDGNDCSLDDRCGPTGSCVPGPCDPARTECEFCAP